MSTQTLVSRRQTAFRLREDLLNRLTVEAKRQNRSLNNYVESALMKAIYRKPNHETLDAIKEAQEDLNMTELDMTNIDTFLKSLE
ncbi:MAG: toxin-antitoxin system HicB family antitoxin [Firmicutes bacterium]|nr:toxin-antitoxin system HicB family antitoxin [Bacillota bacterium]